MHQMQPLKRLLSGFLTRFRTYSWGSSKTTHSREGVGRSFLFPFQGENHFTRRAAAAIFLPSVALQRAESARTTKAVGPVQLSVSVPRLVPPRRVDGDSARSSRSERTRPGVLARFEWDHPNGFPFRNKPLRIRNQMRARKCPLPNLRA